jgi:hypothetical protein
MGKSSDEANQLIRASFRQTTNLDEFNALRDDWNKFDHILSMNLSLRLQNHSFHRYNRRKKAHFAMQQSTDLKLIMKRQRRNL